MENKEKPVGRPASKNPRKFSAFRLPEETKAKIKELAKKHGCSEADVVVDAIEREANTAIVVDSATKSKPVVSVPVLHPGAKLVFRPLMLKPSAKSL